MIYEIKLKIKDYAELSIYTNSEKLKSKLTEANSSIMRTIPITSVTSSLVPVSNVNYSDAIIINDGDKKSMHYDKEYNVSILTANENEIRFPDIVYIALSMFSKILARNEKYLLHSSSVVASTITLITGSVPDSLTNIRPSLPSRFSTSFIFSCTLGSFCASALFFTFECYK